MGYTKTGGGKLCNEKKGQMISSTVGPLYLQVPPPQVSHSWIHQTKIKNIWKKISRMFQRAKFDFAMS